LKVTKSWAGVDLDPNAIASPCGGIAYTVFNDTFQLQSRTGTPIPITDSGITWPGDKGGKYRRASNSNSTQWIDP
jgi:LEM3 (ligand-effect modulator 3) family / CDC50 family